MMGLCQRSAISPSNLKQAGTAIVMLALQAFRLGEIAFLVLHF
jgi:hypothetical protein